MNLRLRVFGPDGSGYHPVETLLLRTDLADTVSVQSADEGIALEVSGPAAGDVPPGADNLCRVAAEAFLAEAFPGRGTRPGLLIRLDKRIPAGTGLGGGSADAAGTLRLLSRAWPRLDERAVFAMAGRLGSDVPFALLDVPMALGWERGRRLLPLRSPRPRPGLVVCPPFRVATPAAYGWLDEARRGADDPGGASILPGPARLAEWDTLSRLVANDFEGPVLGRHPELREALGILRAAAPVAAMTGSGPALFGAFEDETERERARETLDVASLGPANGWLAIDTLLPA